MSMPSTTDSTGGIYTASQEPSHFDDEHPSPDRSDSQGTYFDHDSDIADAEQMGDSVCITSSMSERFEQHYLGLAFHHRRQLEDPDLALSNTEKNHLCLQATKNATASLIAQTLNNSNYTRTLEKLTHWAHEVQEGMEDNVREDNLLASFGRFSPREMYNQLETEEIVKQSTNADKACDALSKDFSNQNLLGLADLCSALIDWREALSFAEKLAEDSQESAERNTEVSRGSQ